MAATADCVYPASMSNCIHGLHVRDSIQVVCFRALNLCIILSAWSSHFVWRNEIWLCWWQYPYRLSGICKGITSCYFQENYAGKYIIAPSVTAASTPRSAFGASQSQNGSPQKVNFTARYKKHPSVRRDQLEEYFKLPREDFDTCDPISWWLGRRSQFPDVFVFARDLLAIPSEDFIDVFHCQCQWLLIMNHRFCCCCRKDLLWWRDTISLRRANLRPDTIWKLMLVKQHLCITQRANDFISNNNQ